VVGEYHLTVLTLIGIWVIVAQGLNVLTGYAGLFNLGVCMYMGTGAYVSALLTTQYDFGFWEALPWALLGSALMGFLAGLPSLRAREDALAVMSIGFVFVFESLLIYLPYFGGPVGIGKIPVPMVGGEPVTKLGYLFLVIGAVILVSISVRCLIRSWIGLAWESLREDELAARIMGIYPPRFKLYAYVIGATYAGLGGVLYAHFINYITPYDFGFLPSIYVLVMVVFGGLGTIRGALFGAAFLTALPEFFRFVQEYRNLIYGGLLVLMMFFEPRGLLGNDSRLWRLVTMLRSYVRAHIRKAAV
jgi:branched-chain amino acid transport system permease protein